MLRKGTVKVKCKFESFSFLKIVLPLFIAFFFSAFEASGQCSLLAYYPLDGNAGDSSTFSNHGTIYGGATSAPNRFNQPNGAMNFDGVNDYINTFTTYDFPYRTVSVWIYAERSSGLNQIFAHDDVNLIYGTFGFRITNGRLDGNSAGNSTQALASINLNQWYHLALVSRPDSGFCYIDGLQVTAEGATSNGSVSGAYDKLVLGVGRQRNQKYYQGRIDDLLIFNCDFSDTQIDSLFTAQSPFPPFDTLSMDTTLCLGDTLLLDLDGGSNISYFWDNGSTDTVRRITNPGIYTLRQTRLGDTLIDTIQLSFITPYLPSSLDTSFCSGDSLSVDYSSLSIDSLVWFDGSTIPQRTFNSMGTFSFTVFQDYCGITIDSIRVSLDTILSPITKDTNSCQNSLIIGARSESFLTYQWSSGQSTSNIEVLESGTYTVRVVGACNTVTDTFKVELPTLLPVQSPVDTLIICANIDSVQIGISINSALSFTWSNSANSTLQWLSQAGSYSLQVFNNCDTIENQYIILNDFIFEPEAIPDTTICELKRLYFDLNHAEVEEVSVNGNLLFNNTFSIFQGGTYIVEYQQECGSAIDTFSVDIISCECDFIMPDAFTPNGDGLNDRFRIDNECENLEQTIQIFNRWGILIFENESNNDFWDGTYKGEPVNGGTYAYKLKYKGLINGQIYEGTKQGFLSLIR